MSHENGGHLKDGLLLGGAIRYVRLFCLPSHSYATATVPRKQVPACVRNLFKCVNFPQYFVCLCERIDWKKIAATLKLTLAIK